MKRFTTICMLSALALTACQQNPVPKDTSAEQDVNAEPALEAQIINGTVTPLGSRPYQAVIQGMDGQCGGSIIDKYWILSAAHCFKSDSTNYMNVRVGLNDLYDYNAQSFGVEKIYRHPNFREYGRNGYDIALLKLSAPIQYDWKTQPVNLPNNYVERRVDRRGNYATVSGWGITESEQHPTLLREVTLPIEPNVSRCGESNTPDNTICTPPHQNKDACTGDSGGPLVSKYNGRFYQIGIVSYGPSSCDGYGVYTRVNGYLNWINRVTGLRF